MLRNVGLGQVSDHQIQTALAGKSAEPEFAARKADVEMAAQAQVVAEVRPAVDSAEAAAAAAASRLIPEEPVNFRLWQSVLPP